MIFSYKAFIILSIQFLIFNYYFKLINNYLLIFININLFDIKMKYILIEFILL
jgi:hypothetical protein